MFFSHIFPGYLHPITYTIYDQQYFAHSESMITKWAILWIDNSIKIWIHWWRVIINVGFVYNFAWLGEGRSHVWLHCICLSLPCQICCHTDRLPWFLIQKCYSLVCPFNYQCKFSTCLCRSMHLFSCWCTCCSPLLNQIYCHCDIAGKSLMSRCYTVVSLLNHLHEALCQPILMIYLHPVYQEFLFLEACFGLHTLYCP